MAKSLLTPEFREFLRLLNDRDVDYLVVGGFAVIAYGYVRATKDIDIWVAVRPANAQRCADVLQEFFGQTLPAEKLLSPQLLFRAGRPPNQIEIMTNIDGVTYDECRRSAIYVELEGIRFPVISLADLRRNKAASGRPQDLADLDNLPPA